MARRWFRCRCPRAIDIGDRALYTDQFLSAIDWALNPDEQQRPQSSEELLTRLRGALAEPVRTTLSAAVDPDRTQPHGVPVAGTREHTKTRPAATQQPTSIPLDAAQLKEIETELAKRIGPLASVLVRKAAKKSTTIEAVIDAVTTEIDDEQERDAFTRRMKENIRPPAAPSHQGDRTEIPTQLAASRFDIGVLNRAETRLAQHIGAIARVIVKKAAMKARDEGELYLIIADEIEDQNDRKAFIRKAISASRKI